MIQLGNLIVQQIVTANQNFNYGDFAVIKSQ